MAAKFCGQWYMAGDPDQAWAVIRDIGTDSSQPHLQISTIYDDEGDSPEFELINGTQARWVTYGHICEVKDDGMLYFSTGGTAMRKEHIEAGAIPNPEYEIFPKLDDVHASRRAAALKMREAELHGSLQNETSMCNFRDLQGSLQHFDRLHSTQRIRENEVVAEGRALDDFADLIASRPVFDPVFSCQVEADWTYMGSPCAWIGGWINPFEALGKSAAACLPLPNFDEWHAVTYDYYTQHGSRDPVVAAVIGGDMTDVEQLLVKPNDILRWEYAGVGSDNMSLLHYAFEVGKLALLRHLFNLSPKHFMQQLTMRTGGAINRTPLQLGLVCCSRSPEKVSDFLEVLQWMCRSGVMTGTVFKYCAAQGGGEWNAGHGMRPTKWKSALEFAETKIDSAGMSDVVEELERWNALPHAEQVQLTEDQFVTLLAPALPKKLVSIEIDDAEIKCRDLGGEFLVSVTVDSLVDSASLYDRIAATVGLSQEVVRLIKPNGDILSRDPAVPLSDCLS